MSEEKKTLTVTATLLVGEDNNWVLFGSSDVIEHDWLDVLDESDMWQESARDNHYQVVMEVPAFRIKQIRVRPKFRSSGEEQP